MKKVFCFILIFLGSSICFAGWRDARQDADHLTTKKEVDTYLLECDKEFFLPYTRAKNGFKITALDQDISSMVSLRYLNDKVDFEVKFLEALYKDSGSVYLQLLDEDKFLIKSIFISRVVEGFQGEILGDFNMTWDTFRKIKYYKISMRV